MEVVLQVSHETRAQWHTFTSSDVPGLFVMGQSDHLSDLLDSLPATIAALVEARTGKSADVRRLDYLLGQEGHGSSPVKRARAEPASAQELMQFLLVTPDGH